VRRDGSLQHPADRRVDAPHAQPRTRWPRFTRRALDAGFTAVTALPLRSHDRLLGTLNLYHQHGALHREDVCWCQLLAAAAALGLAHHDLLREARCRGEQLQGALDSRVVIEQAKGILAERLDCPVQDAFALLRRHARTNRMKLTDLCAQIIDGPADAGPFPRPPCRASTTAASVVTRGQGASEGGADPPGGGVGPAVRAGSGREVSGLPGSGANQALPISMAARKITAAATAIVSLGRRVARSRTPRRPRGLRRVWPVRTGAVGSAYVVAGPVSPSERR